MNLTNLTQLLTQAIPFIAVFAGLAAALIMYRVTQKFASGILADGFRSITFGVLFVVGGILLDAFASYFIVVGSEMSVLFLIAKGLLFVAGTYIIVIGSKRMADRLENLH